MRGEIPQLVRGAEEGRGMTSPGSIHTNGNEVAVLSPWLGFAALLAAPLVAAIGQSVVFDIGARVAGYQPASPSWEGLKFVYFGFALVFVPLGGLLMRIFWRRAPFGALLSATFGAVGGALVGLMAIAMLSYDVGSTLLMVAAALGPGVVGGVAGGLSVWVVCRLGLRWQK